MSTSVQKEAVQLEGLESDGLASLLKKEFKPKTDQAREAVENAVRTLAEQALANTVTMSSDAYSTIQAIIAEIDHKLSEQINLIMHNDEFQKLEGAWRGLHYLVNNSETDELLKIRVMCITKKELGRTLKRYKASAGTRARFSSVFTKKNTASLVVSPSAALWAIITLIIARQTLSCWVKWHASLPQPTAHSFPVRRLKSCRWIPGRNWPIRAI